MDARILQSLNLIETRLDRDLHVESLAAEAGLSLFHFHRMFIRDVGQTPADYVRRVRLDGAALRLRWTREPVSAVASSLGYTSQAAFTRAFRDRFGVTPLQFRRDCRIWPPLPIDGRLSFAVTERQLSGYRCLARRFFGSLKRVPERWRTYIDELPEFVTMSASGPYLGLVYDDPRFTPPEQVRYDCCILLPESAESIDANRLARHGLREFHTRPGRYVCQPHHGGYIDVGKSYSRLLDHWIASSGHSLTDDPAIEWYDVPPLRGSTGVVDILLMFPIR